MSHESVTHDCVAWLPDRHDDGHWVGNKILRSAGHHPLPHRLFRHPVTGDCCYLSLWDEEQALSLGFAQRQGSEQGLKPRLPALKPEALHAPISFTMPIFQDRPHLRSILPLPHPSKSALAVTSFFFFN